VIDRSARLLLLAAVVLAGCATGEPFKKLETIPTGKAVIYIYRPSMIGAAIVYDVKRGDKVIITTKARGYYPYVSDPGEVELWAQTESKASITLDVKAGEVYYVKASVSVGLLVGRPRLNLVSALEAEEEIVDCKLLVPEGSEAKKE
jgi:hypothetical protein